MVDNEKTTPYNNTHYSNQASRYYKSNDVLQVDYHTLANVKATFTGAHSYIEWFPSSINATIPSPGATFQVIPLQATVDRRPIIARKQLWNDASTKKKLGANGRLLGCAISATTFVSHLEMQDLERYRRHTPTCHVCFQFSNREDMKRFVPDLGYEPLNEGQLQTATKCISGKATLKASFFAGWQRSYKLFKGFGSPWTVDCEMPNGIEELTCREISKVQKSIEERDNLQHIYFKTRFILYGKSRMVPNPFLGNSSSLLMPVTNHGKNEFNTGPTQFNVHSRWPWTSLMSHDDDRSKIAEGLENFWNDNTSSFVPSGAEELKLANVEGPTYTNTKINGSLSLQSMISNPDSNGGLHARLLPNLFHLVRNAPGSTHIIGVVDGQFNQTYQNLVKILETKLSVMYLTYGNMFDDERVLQSQELMSIQEMNNKAGIQGAFTGLDITMLELLSMRKIKILLVPILTPSLVFEKSVCGGQYPFATFLSARFSADYHAIIYRDGDTALLEKSETLQSIIYRRLFSNESSKCVGHRMQLIEHYLKPNDRDTQKVLQCIGELTSDPGKWEYSMKNCALAAGHIVARTDSVYSMNVHIPTTLSHYLPKGIKDCTSKNKGSFLLKETDLVELHLRDRQRKEKCKCES